MNSMKCVSVIPAYNEAEVLPRLIEKLNSVIGTGQIFPTESLIVNDGSSDGTEAISYAIGGKPP